MRLWNSSFAVVLAVLGHTSPASCAAAEVLNGPVGFAKLWLEALRTDDLKRLKELSALPITIKGFNLPSGPEAIACGGKPRRDGLVGVSAYDPRGGIELVIPDDAAFERGYQCLRQDNMLVHYIPEVRWPRDRHDYRDSNVGEIGLVKSTRLARRLQRYRGDVRKLPPEDFLVQARMTDNNGVTNHVLLVLTPAPSEGTIKVRGVYIDELFEE